jgi:hypothetical protein
MVAAPAVRPVILTNLGSSPLFMQSFWDKVPVRFLVMVVFE